LCANHHEADFSLAHGLNNRTFDVVISPDGDLLVHCDSIVIFDCNVFSNTCKYIWKEGTRAYIPEDELNSGKLTDEQYGHVLAMLPPHQHRLCLVMYACVSHDEYLAKSKPDGSEKNKKVVKFIL